MIVWLRAGTGCHRALREWLAALLTLPFHHRDPFDRLLLAQAKAEGMTLVTDDGQVGL